MNSKEPYRVVAVSAGGPEVLRAETFAPAPPGPGQVLLRQEWIGVNWVDTQHRAGTPFPVSFPLVVGIEAAGTVEAAGSGTPWRIGQKAAYAGIMPGVYASHAVVDAARLAPLPEGLDPQLAAAGLMQGSTALMLSRRIVNVRPGERVLVHAAAGGVGGLAVQDLKAFGALVDGTVSDESKVAAVRDDGADEVFVVPDDQAWERCRTRLTNSGIQYRAILDGVGGGRLPGGLRLLQARGVYALFGVAGGPPDLLQPNDLSGITGIGTRGSIWLTWPALNDYWASNDDYQTLTAETLEALRSGALRPRIAAEFPLEKAADAHRLLETRRVAGKIVLRV